MTKTRYDFNYLQKFCEENSIKLLEDYSNNNITRDAIIQGKCLTQNCDNNFNKKFRLLLYIGGYCKKCSIRIGNEKKKQTCLKKFGVEYSLQNNDVREKSKLTIKDKYGVDCISHNPNIRKKAQNTMLKKYGDIHALKIDEFKNKAINTMNEKYGVNYAGQSEEIKEKIKNTCKEKYGTDCVLKNDAIKEKIKQTNLENYGVQYATQSQEIKEKIKTTCNEKYGVDYYLQTEDIKIKSKKTCNEKYGVDYYLQSEDIKIKSKKTCNEKYGVDYYLQSEDKQTKSKETSIKNYGVEYPMQNPDYADAISKKTYMSKEYSLPSGKIIQIQGYENYAIDELLRNVNEDDIVNGTKNVPEIWYCDENEMEHRHFVDIFIPSQNRCIEVKSTWTAEKKKDNIFLKQEAGKKLGYEYEIWVYNSKGEKVECYI